MRLVTVIVSSFERIISSTVLSPASVPSTSGQCILSSASAATFAEPYKVFTTIRLFADETDSSDSASIRMKRSVRLLSA